MNEQFEHCLYQAGLTAQGCWDELDDYAKEGIQKFAELLIKECADFVRETYDHEAAESIAWNMEIKYGLHGDYA